MSKKSEITAKPEKIETTLKIGNQTVGISGASLSPIQLRDVRQSTVAFIHSLKDLSDKGIVIPEDGATEDAPD